MKIKYTDTYNPDFFIDTEEDLKNIKENKDGIADMLLSVQKVMLVNSSIILPALFNIKVISSIESFDDIDDEIGGKISTTLIQLPKKYVDIEDSDGTPITPNLVAKTLKNEMVACAYLLGLNDKDTFNIFDLEDIKFYHDHLNKVIKIKYGAVLDEWTIDDYNREYKVTTDKLNSWNEKIDKDMKNPNTFGEV